MDWSEDAYGCAVHILTLHELAGSAQRRFSCTVPAGCWSRLTKGVCVLHLFFSITYPSSELAKLYPARLSTLASVVDEALPSLIAGVCPV